MNNRSWPEAAFSQAVKQIILQDGVVGGRARIRQQFNLFSVAAHSIKEEDQEDLEKKTKDDCTACDMTQVDVKLHAA